MINPPGAVGSNLIQASPEPVSNQITTGLDDSVIGIDKYISKYAPTLAKDIKELQKRTGVFGRIKGWTLEYGVAGECSQVDTLNKSILIDPNKKGNLDELVRSSDHI